MLFHNYDIILSSHRECLYMSRQQGARNTEYAFPGMPAELATKFSAVKRTDLCFSGYWAVSHPQRNKFLFELATRLPALPIDCAYYLGFYNQGPPCPEIVQRYNRGEVWGLAMFKAFACSRITLNGFGSINSGHQNLSPNMRQLEGMGVGSLMLTERSDNLSAFFTEGHDLVTYATTEDLIDKALYYLGHEDEREQIAARGKATCLKYYNLDIRARAFLDTVDRVLEAGTAPPPGSLIRALKAIVAAFRHDASVAGREDVQTLWQTLWPPLWPPPMPHFPDKVLILPFRAGQRACAPSLQTRRARNSGCPRRHRRLLSGYGRGQPLQSGH